MAQEKHSIYKQFYYYRELLTKDIYIKTSLLPSDHTCSTPSISEARTESISSPKLRHLLVLYFILNQFTTQMGLEPQTNLSKKYQNT